MKRFVYGVFFCLLISPVFGAQLFLRGYVPGVDQMGYSTTEDSVRVQYQSNRRHRARIEVVLEDEQGSSSRLSLNSAQAEFTNLKMTPTRISFIQQ